MLFLALRGFSLELPALLLLISASGVVDDLGALSALGSYAMELSAVCLLLGECVSRQVAEEDVGCLGCMAKSKYLASRTMEFVDQPPP